MSNLKSTHTPTVPSAPERRVHVYIVNAAGRASTVPILLSALSHLHMLARGAGIDSPRAHVTSVMRRIAREMVAEGFCGTWAPEVRKRALFVLRGTYRPASADAFDRAQLPDGREVRR